MEKDVRYELFEYIGYVLSEKERASNIPLGAKECFYENADDILDVFEAWPGIKESLEKILKNVTSDVYYDIFMYKVMSTIMHFVENDEVARDIRSCKDSKTKNNIMLTALTEKPIIESMLYDYYLELQREHLSYGVNAEILGKGNLFTPEQYAFLKENINRNTISKVLVSRIASNVKIKCFRLLCQDRYGRNKSRDFAREMRHFKDLHNTLKSYLPRT